MVTADQAQLNLPRGYAIAGDFSGYSPNVTITAGAGVGAASPIVITTRAIPSAARVYIDRLMLRTIDAQNNTQIFFALLLDGIPFPPWNSIIAEHVSGLDPWIWIQRDFYGSSFGVAGINISGAGQPTSDPNPLDTRVVAGWRGYLLRETGRR